MSVFGVAFLPHLLSLSQDACVYTHVHTYTCVCVRAYVPVCVYTRVRTCIHVPVGLKVWRTIKQRWEIAGGKGRPYWEGSI